MNQENQLRQLIRESIQEYILEVEASGNIAAQEAKIRACEEAIALREKKANLDGIDETMHEMIDSNKINEIKKEIKELQKYKAKAEKVLEKMKMKAEGKTTKKMEDEGMEEEGMVDEVNLDEYTADPAAGPQLEELTPEESEELRKKAEANDKEYNITNEMLLMQKRAGIISETEYRIKVEEAKKKMTAAQKEKKEDIVKGMKKSKSFGKSKDEKSKMYATATKLATKKSKSLKEEVQALFEDDLNEKMSYDDFEQMIKPFLDLAKSKGWVWNSSGDSWIQVPSPAIALYHTDTLPTTKDGEYKGQPHPLAKDAVASRAITYRDKLATEKADVIMNPDYDSYEGAADFYSKDKNILDTIKKTMASTMDVAQDIKEVSSQFTSGKDFEPQKYFYMELKKKV